MLAGLVLLVLQFGAVAARADTAAPQLAFSSYLGGTEPASTADGAVAVAIDSSGNTIVAGSTSATDFPLAGPRASVAYGGGSSDAYVTKLAPSGAIVWSTYIGGSGVDGAAGVAVDPSGNVYVAGLTSSSNFPTKNPYAGYHDTGGTSDGFVAKFTTDGDLAYSTFLGAADVQPLSAIAVNASGEAFVAGRTTSKTLPLIGPGGQVDDVSYVFVAKLTATGSTVGYRVRIGGESGEQATGIAIDGAGNAYITGDTSSTGFPHIGAVQPTKSGSAGSDAFVAKLNATGSALIYSTFLGGTGTDTGTAIALDGAGNAYLTGETSSSDFPTAGAYQRFKGETASSARTAFVTKLNPAGNTLVYSTYLGGTMGESGRAIAVDAQSNASVAGYAGPTFPTTHSFGNPDTGHYHAFLSTFDSAGSNLLRSTLFGGQSTDYAFGLAVTPAGSATVVGQAASTNFPLAAPQQNHLNGAADGFVSRIVTPPANQTAPGITGSAQVGQTLNCDHGTWTSTAPPTFTVQWLQDGQPINGATQDSYTVTDGNSGHVLSCRVTADNGQATAAKDSAGIQATTPPSAPTTQPTVNPDHDGDGSLPPLDCNDNNPTIHPGATDIPGNGVDEDCSGADAAYPHVAAKVANAFKLGKLGTSVVELTVKSIPAGGMVRVLCTLPKKAKGKAKRACPFKAKTFKVSKGQAAITAAFKGKKLPAGSVIELRMTAPSNTGRVVQYVMRNNKRPTVLELCLPPGASKPGRC